MVEPKSAAGLPARKAALAILSGVLQKRRPLDAGQLAGLAARDAGFARALASQTLRHLGALDAVLRKFMKKPMTGKSAELPSMHTSKRPHDRSLCARPSRTSVSAPCGRRLSA